MITQTALSAKDSSCSKGTAVNFWNVPTPELPEMLRSRPVFQYARDFLPPVLAGVFGDRPKLPGLADEICRIVAESRGLPLFKLEQQIYAHLTAELGAISPKEITSALDARSKLIASQLHSYIAGRELLDWGCGNGATAQLLAASLNLSLTLCDVYRHPRLAQAGINFKQIQGYRLPNVEPFADTTLLVTVLHHSEDPRATLAEAVRLTKPGGRILVIESVTGVQAQDLTNLDGCCRPPTVQERALAKLTPEERHCASAFFDWLYNRIVFYTEDSSQKVLVPFNFLSRCRWEEEFGRAGLRDLQTTSLGIDLPGIVPEFHTLHILERLRD